MRFSKLSTFLKTLFIMNFVAARPSLDLTIGGSFPVSVKAEGQATALMLFIGLPQHQQNVTATSHDGSVILCNSTTVQPETIKVPRNCREVQALGRNESGIYTIYPYVSSPERYIDVFCDMITDGGGWTLIQRRSDYITQEDFYRSWQEYAKGFGRLNRDFWLGLEHIHALTNQSSYEAWFNFMDFGGNTRHAKYRTFAVGDEAHFFPLRISGYSGDAGDSMSYHEGMKFSTFDKDNDLSESDCANKFSAAWWYKNCHHANLNGKYHREGSGASDANIVWHAWKGSGYSLKRSEIKIRPSVV